MNKRFSICLFLLVFIVGCSNASKYEDKKVAEINSMNAETVVSKFPDFSYTSKDGDYEDRRGNIVVSPKGYYFKMNTGKLIKSELPWYFYNVDTDKVSILCSDPTCNHTDKETCEAYFINHTKNPDNGSDVSYQMRLGFYNNRLYSVVYDEKGVYMVTFDEMGKDRIVQCVIEEDPSWICDGFVIYDNTLYTCMRKYTQKGDDLQYTQKVVAFDLKDNSKKNIYEDSNVIPGMRYFFDAGKGGSVGLMVRNKKIYITDSRKSEKYYNRVLIMEYDPSNGSFNQVFDMDEIMPERKNSDYIEVVEINNEDIYLLLKHYGDMDENGHMYVDYNKNTYTSIYKYSMVNGVCDELGIEKVTDLNRTVFIDQKYIYDNYQWFDDAAAHLLGNALCIYDIYKLTLVAEYKYEYNADNYINVEVRTFGLDDRCILTKNIGYYEPEKHGIYINALDLRDIGDDYEKWHVVIGNVN